MKTALVAGGSGLVGRHLLQYLWESPRYEQVISLGRRPSGAHHPKLKEIAADFGDLKTVPPALHADDAYCALGTTMKDAGSKEAFHRVDCEYVVEFARLAQSLGAKQLVIVSAMGTKENSWFYYPRVKAEMEKRVSELGFPSLTMVRPSLILGHRQKMRPLENLGQGLFQWLTPLMKGPLRHLRPNRASAIAHAMLRAAEQETPGAHVIPSRDL